MSASRGKAFSKSAMRARTISFFMLCENVVPLAVAHATSATPNVTIAKLVTATTHPRYLAASKWSAELASLTKSLRSTVLAVARESR
jgi:hypothetical protein